MAGFGWPMVWCLLSRCSVASTLRASCGRSSICYAIATMSNTPLEEAMDRAERALIRIERAVERDAMHSGRDDGLREKIAGALSELDDIIREAGR